MFSSHPVSQHWDFEVELSEGSCIADASGSLGWVGLAQRGK